MHHTLTSEIANSICQLIATGDIEKILSAFDIFLEIDSSIIQESAEDFINQADISLILENRFSGESLRDRLLMEVFYASMLDYLCEKCHKLENSVEHDIQNWIDSNSLELAQFNAEVLRLAIQGGGKLEDIDPCVNLVNLENRQRKMLEDTWSNIENRVDDLIKNLG